MNFKFYPIESRIYDFLEFPGLIFAEERYVTSKNEYDYKEFPMDDYLVLIKNIGNKLEPYKKDIELFYNKNFFGDYDFIELISKTKGIFGYKNEEEYLNMLLSLSEKDINQSITYSIISSIEDSQEYSDEIMSRASDISMDRGNIISIIKDLPIESSIKWTLFLIVEEPVKYMKAYVDLMNNLLSIFRELYSPYEDEVKSYGEYLEDFLYKNGANGLEEISYSILDSKLMNDGENNILVSAMVQFALTISSKGKDYYVCWGLNIDKVFKKMRELNENKVNERVQVFKNLGDKTRYEVVKLIASGETSTKEIANILGVSSATISYHINNLIQAKIIKLDRMDNRYNYVVDYNILENIIKGLQEDLKFPQD